MTPANHRQRPCALYAPTGRWPAGRPRMSRRGRRRASLRASMAVARVHVRMQDVRRCTCTCASAAVGLERPPFGFSGRCAVRSRWRWPPTDHSQADAPPGGFAKRVEQWRGRSVHSHSRDRQDEVAFLAKRFNTAAERIETLVKSHESCLRRKNRCWPTPRMNCVRPHPHSHGLELMGAPSSPAFKTKLNATLPNWTS